jgi:hypothetical protein
MNEKDLDSIYYSTDFAKQIAEIRENPRTLDTKEKLVSLWRLALRDRSNNKSVQDYIATEASRETGVVEYGNTEDDPYMAIIMQFHLMDHMREGAEADREWSELASMLSKIKV